MSIVAQKIAYGRVLDMALSPNGKQLATVTAERQINVYDYATRRLTHTYKPSADVMHLDFIRSGTALFVGIMRPRFLSFDLARRGAAALEEHTLTYVPDDFHVSRNADTLVYVAFVHNDGWKMLVVSLTTTTDWHLVLAVQPYFPVGALSDDGRFFVAAGNTIHVVNLHEQYSFRSFTFQPQLMDDCITSIALTHNNQFIVAGTANARLLIAKMPPREALVRWCQLPAHEHTDTDSDDDDDSDRPICVSRIDVAPDDKYFVTRSFAGGRRFLDVWHFETLTCMRRLEMLPRAHIDARTAKILFPRKTCSILVRNDYAVFHACLAPCHVIYRTAFPLLQAWLPPYVVFEICNWLLAEHHCVSIERETEFMHLEKITLIERIATHIRQLRNAQWSAQSGRYALRRRSILSNKAAF